MKLLLLSLALSMSLPMFAASLQEVPLKDIDGKATSLKAYEGKVVLLVNVASQCGLTPQYKQLEALQQKYKDKGFTVLGVPCNDFGSQEPGTNEEIKQFCSSKYSVSFPLLDKVHVKGAGQHPLYTQLTGKDAKFPGDIEWNFGKFLIDKKGNVVKRFKPQTRPDDASVTAAIDESLAAR